MYLHLSMQTKIAKWGNSYAVRIPGKVIDRLSLSEGENLAVDVVGDTINLAPFQKSIPRYSLKEILKGIKPMRLTKEDREWLDSPPIGKERI